MSVKSTFRIFLLLSITSAILFTRCNGEDTSNRSINIGPNLTTEKAPVMWEVKSKKIDDETIRMQKKSEISDQIIDRVLNQLN